MYTYFIQLTERNKYERHPTTKQQTRDKTMEGGIAEASRDNIVQTAERLIKVEGTSVTNKANR